MELLKRLDRDTVLLIFYAIGSGMGVGWVGDAINDGPLFKGWLWADCWMPLCVTSTWGQTLISLVLALLLTLFCAYQLATQIGRGKVAQMKPRPSTPHRVLIMWLSSFKDWEDLEPQADGSSLVVWRAMKGGEIVNKMMLSADRNWAVDEKNSPVPRWNMWQNLRIVQPHAKRLDAIYCLVTQGSQERFGFTQKFLRYYLQLPADCTLESALVDENDIQGQIAAVQTLIKQAKSELSGLEDSDIMVDCTNGMKPSSIAAACATLNNPIELQYVNTNTQKVETYQLVYMAPQNS